MNSSPIGIFDSGIGGLSVFSRLVNLLPDENYIYFADTKNLPYGSKSQQELIQISMNIFEFFKSKNVKAVIMACNTTSAAVYDYVKTKFDFEIYPVVQSVSKVIASKINKRIGVFATQAVINLHCYKNEIQKYNPNIKVFETACPEWVPIVENSLFNEQKSIENIKMRLEIMLKNKPEKIILGCTHYPYLLPVLSKFAPESIFTDPAVYFAEIIAGSLKTKNLLNSEKASPPVFYASAEPEKFEKSSSLFCKVSHAELFSDEKKKAGLILE